MGRRTIRPTGQERTLGTEELIVSKTDPKGVITYANHVFARIARYAPDELVGRPHSVIRHPEMPRGVFNLLWTTIQSGQEIFAYVNNLAADGANYWVLAHVTPTFDRRGNVIGYHSNRRCPERAAVEAIGSVYRGMLAEEARHVGAIEAGEAGARWLGEVLAEKQQTYDRFVWELISGAQKTKAS